MALLLGLVIGGVAVAGTSSTTLPNGADLSVSIDDPETSTEFLIAEGENTRDITVQGTASIGEGEPSVTLIHVIDGSGSTAAFGGACGEQTPGDPGGGAGPDQIIDCEILAVKNLNAAAIGLASETALILFAGAAVTADVSPDPGDQPLTAPDADLNNNGILDVHEVLESIRIAELVGQDSGFWLFTQKDTPDIIGTNFGSGIQAALDVAALSANPTKVVAFLSDGVNNVGPHVNTLLPSGGVIFHTFAVGAAASCLSDPTNRGSLQDIADLTGGTCTNVPDPGVLPDVLPDLVSTTLESLEVSVNGGPFAPIAAGLPVAGPAAVPYSVTVPDLPAGDHEICVRATGSDTAGTASVTRCETIHLYEFTLEPAHETNELGQDNEHTVTATLIGDHDLAGRPVTFEVTGTNPQGPVVVLTDAAGVATFSYTVPVAPSSLGMDTISASITLNDPMGETATRTVTKEWVDTTPPVASCVESVNPHGQTIPRAPGQGGQGQNQDGFYQLLAEDDVWPAEDLEIFVVDPGTGTVFGPYAVGTNIQYRQAPGATPTERPMGSGTGQAGAVSVQIIGQGDAQVFAVDGSGNVSDPVDCLVPPPPM